MAVEFKIQGIDRLMASLNKVAQEKRDAIHAEIEASCYDITAKAKSRVPKKLGFLANSISTADQSQGTKINFEIIAQKSYAPYVEFGTVTKVSVPVELQEYALQFKGKGIKQTGGMPSRPFFFNSFAEEKVKLINRIKEILVEKR